MSRHACKISVYGGQWTRFLVDTKLHYSDLLWIVQQLKLSHEE